MFRFWQDKLQQSFDAGFRKGLQFGRINEYRRILDIIEDYELFDIETIKQKIREKR